MGGAFSVALTTRQQ